MVRGVVKNPGKNGGNGTSGDPSADGKDGQDKKGRFVKGNTCGKGGNPNIAFVHKVTKLLHENTPPETLIRVWNALILKAEQGDVRAAEAILNRLAGKPFQAIAIEGSLTMTVADYFRSLAEQVRV